MATPAVRLRPPEGDRLDPLMACAAQLGADELAVLVLVAERLVRGRQIYGELNLATDVRDFRREALEEAADMAVYAAAALLRGRA
jgi:hypothetical protein